jgi:hypothetical protein
MGDTGERGLFVGLALPIFAETGACIEAKARPIENSGGTAQVRLDVMIGCGRDASVKIFKNCKGERFLPLLWLIPCAM